MLVRLLALVLVLASGACRCGKEAEPVAARATEPPDSTAEGGLPFIRDDYDRALALARERKLPLFVDAWAPWCHSCLSMERTVFPDPRLRPMADRFVWLSLNTEKEESVAFLQKFPQTVIEVGDSWAGAKTISDNLQSRDRRPTFTILDPESERPLARSLGSLTVDELLGLLGDALRAAAAEAPRPDALLASEHADPDDYNPPARLAEVYLRLGRLDEALAACNRALEKVYGPRKARVLNLQGEIFRARGEYQKARIAHEAALIVNGRLPEVQQSGREVFRAQKGLLELEKLR